MGPTEYDLKGLCEVAEVTPRTVHFYIQLGLLPRAGSPGPGVRYGPGHVARLRLIRLLQREHLPLAEIRQRIEPLDRAQVERLLNEYDVRREVPPSSAADYIRGVLEGRSPAPRSLPPQHRAQPLRPDVCRISKVTERSQWERLSLSSDVELHIRRPLSRQQNRQLDRLLTFSRELFKEDSHDS